MASLITTWLVVLAVGFAAVYRHAGHPGPAMTPAATTSPWSVAKRWTVVMAAHGSCPCTTASIRALREVLHGHPSRPLLRIVRMDGVTEPALWQGELSGFDAVEVLTDPDATQLRTAGFATSGEIHVVDPSGRLQFHGGVTPARGHGGTCPGLRAVDATLRGGPPGSAPVFGCPLFASRVRSSI